jgi:hypothetical protein
VAGATGWPVGQLQLRVLVLVLGSPSALRTKATKGTKEPKAGGPGPVFVVAKAP